MKVQLAAPFDTACGQPEQNGLIGQNYGEKHDSTTSSWHYAIFGDGGSGACATA